MTQNTYQDGFPKTPLEAIEQSYFLSDSEKQEWRDWLGSANEAQKEELVDILHSMWTEGQKNVVPKGFSQGDNQSQQPTQPTSSPAPIAQQQPPIQQPQNPLPPAPNPFTAAAKPTQQAAPANPTPKPVNPSFSFDEDFSNEERRDSVTIESLVNNNKYKPNPLLDNSPETPSPAATNSQPPKSTPAPSKPQINSDDGIKPISQNEFEEDAFANNINNKPLNKPVNNGFQNTAPQPKKKTIQQKPKRTMLDLDEEDRSQSKGQRLPQNDIVDFSIFERLNDKPAIGEVYKSYSTQTKSAQQQEEELWKKVTYMLTTIEKMAEYFQVMMGKVLDINDKVVKQAQEIEKLKGDDRYTYIQDEIRDIERKMEDDRRRLRRVDENISSQLAGLNMDSFGTNGLEQKLELIRSEVNQLKMRLGSNNNLSQNNHSGGSSFTGNLNNKANKRDDYFPTSRPNLDMRGLI